MSTTSTHVTTDFGDFAVIDFGGTGRGAFLVHDALDNAEYFRPAAEAMAQFCHPVAVDIQGHGQTAVHGLTQAELITALSQVVTALGFDKPLFVGERIGGWFLTVGSVRGQLDPGALLMLESAYCGTLAQMEELFSQFDIPEFYDMTVARMRLGERVASADRERFVAELLASVSTDWSFDDIPVELLRGPVQRALLPQEGGGYLRQPDRETLIRTVRSGFESDIFPCDEVYRGIDVPAHFIMTSESQYHDFPAAIDAMIAQDPRRALTVVRAQYNVSLTNTPTVVSVAHKLIKQLDGELV